MKSSIIFNLTFSKRLKAICKKRKYTQRMLRDSLSEYGDKFDITIDSIKKWYRGDSIPTLSKFYALCEILDCSADYLLGKIDERNFDFEFIKEKTGLKERTIKAMQINKAITQSIEYLLLEEYNQRTKDNYWGQLHCVLTHITDYLATDDNQKATLKMLELQQHLTVLRSMMITTRKSNIIKLV